MLMDQSFTAGIGNLYSDEMLYQAGLRYDRPSNTLTATEVRRLYRAIVETLADAIKHRGSSLADEQYRDLFGEVGDFQGSHQVYDREGQAVPALPQRDRAGQDRRPLDLLLRALPGLTGSGLSRPVRAVGPAAAGPVGSPRCS